jgi:hypothetical protein
MNVKVPWTVPWPDYSPPDFTAPFILTAAWADPPLDSKAHDEKRGGFITMNDRVRYPWSVPWPDYSPPDFTCTPWISPQPGQILHWTSIMIKKEGNS